MAGTTAGIQKARAARLANIAARKAAKEARAASGEVEPEQPPTILNDAPTIANDPPTVGNDATLPGSLGGSLIVGNAENGTVSEIQTLGAGQIMAPLVPVAADVVLKVLQGRLKVPASVRASTALRVVELHVGQAGKGGGDPDELPMLAKLAQALGARAPRAPVTVDAERVSVEADSGAKGVSTE